MGWTNDPHNWEQIGNDHGIYPPKDYEGSYAEYVKFKMYEDQDSLIDSYYDAHPEQDINEPFRDEFSPEVRAAARGSGTAGSRRYKSMSGCSSTGVM